MPVLIKNFFEDQGVIEEAKKRYSVGGNVLAEQIARLGNVEEIYKCRSNYDGLGAKIKTKEVDKDKESISNFSIETCSNANTSSVSIGAGNGFNFAKRDSIFKEGRSYFEYNPVEEEEIKDDLSVVTDSEDEEN